MYEWGWLVLNDFYEIVLELGELKEEDIDEFWRRISYYKNNKPGVFEKLKSHFPEISSFKEKRVVEREEDKSYGWVFPSLLIVVGLVFLFNFMPVDLGSFFEQQVGEEPAPVAEEKVSYFNAVLACNPGEEEITLSLTNNADYSVNNFTLIIRRGSIVEKTYQDFSLLNSLEQDDSVEISFSAEYLVRGGSYEYSLFVSNKTLSGQCIMV